MPIYEYDCAHCGVFETTQRITDPPLGRCPTCKRKVRRLISNTSFQLKGSGWYVTDYARSGNGGKDKSSATDGSSTKAETTEKADKPAKSVTSEKKSAPAASASTSTKSSD